MLDNKKTRHINSKQWERIEEWSRRKPVFALMGEFSAGKSTLMNFLLGKETLPTQVTATQLPPVWFSWGNRSPYVLRNDGRREDITLDRLEEVGVEDAQFVRIFVEAEILEAVDLIDTPGISDPKISGDVWQRAVGQANGVIWCTHATQAWRETERATWVSLPERLQQNSLLLITRSDTLGAKDRQKVLRRLNRETGSLFNRLILFSARDAINARVNDDDPELALRSGSGKMFDSLSEITESIMNTRAQILARYDVEKTGSVATQSPYLLRQENEVTPQGNAVRPQSDNSVAIFPVRPARVLRREEDRTPREERTRIDVDEAQKLREQLAHKPELSVAEGPTPELDVEGAENDVDMASASEDNSTSETSVDEASALTLEIETQDDESSHTIEMAEEGSLEAGVDVASDAEEISAGYENEEDGRMVDEILFEPAASDSTDGSVDVEYEESQNIETADTSEKMGRSECEASDHSAAENDVFEEADVELQTPELSSQDGINSLLASLSFRLSESDSAPEPSEITVDGAQADTSDDDPDIKGILSSIATSVSAQSEAFDPNASESLGVPTAKAEHIEDTQTDDAGIEDEISFAAEESTTGVELSEVAEALTASGAVMPLADLMPDSNAQPDAVEVASEDCTGEEPYELMNETPLSAASMWREITRCEGTSSDPEALLNMFDAFLAEFDQIASEHHTRLMRDALASIPGVDVRSGSEWHVL
ncbi:dynamin family protein [Roseovarius sp. EL26]|uniref:dynamin family protein n=1 Tax=Roseovarius sp. EL26 TaxID=2126672 RepID=UPI000EA1C27A|nr:dynamin family protein [Roseovarius sp. EL26]